MTKRDVSTGVGSPRKMYHPRGELAWSFCCLSRMCCSKVEHRRDRGMADIVRKMIDMSLPLIDRDRLPRAR